MCADKIGDVPKPPLHEIFRKNRSASSASLYSVDQSSNGITDAGHGKPADSEYK